MARRWIPAQTDPSAQVDLFALGVILFILLSGYHPFDPEGLADDEQLAKQIVVGNAHWEEESWRHVSAEARQVFESGEQ